MRLLELRHAIAAYVLASLSLTAAGAQPAGIDTIEFHAPSLDRAMRYDLILPAGYDDPANAARRYPTLYLLHDAGEHAGSWWPVLDGASSTTDHELILVMPDVGDSYYLDWARSDDDQSHQWESYIIDDLRRHVETTFRALVRREGRAVTGFGMGGYGALVLGLRNPALFISIGSQSGDLWWARAAAERMRLGGPARPTIRYAPAVEAARLQADPTVGVPDFRTLVERTPRGQPFLTTSDADAHDPFMLVMRVARDQIPLIQIDASTIHPRLEASQALASMVLDADLAVAFTQQRRGDDSADRTAMYEEAIARHYRVMQQALE